MRPDTPRDTADDPSAESEGVADEPETDTSFVWNTDAHSGDDAPSVGATNGERPRVFENGYENASGNGYTNENERGDPSETSRQPAAAEREPTLDPERYLLAGEAVVEYIEANRGWVAVTTHRLLIFDPTASGKRFERVDRPNVLDVGVDGGGNPAYLSYISRAAMYAVVLLGGGLVGRSLGLRNLFATTAGSASTPAVDGLVSTLSFVGALVGLVVDAFIWSGVLAGLVALGLAVWYLRGRHPTLVIERAGEDDITVRLPTAVDGERVVTALESALDVELSLASS